MAKQMIFDAPDGTTYATSYWRASYVSLNVASSTAEVVFFGYKDHEARIGGKETIGRKTYEVGADLYPTYFGLAALQASDPLAQAYAVCDADIDGSGFFAAATDV